MGDNARSWRVSALSVRGTSHVKSGQPCQDATHWAVEKSGLLLLAAADGAGSAKESLRGAETACKAAIEFLQKQEFNASSTSETGRKVCKEAATAALNAVMAEAEKSSIPVRELASTFIVMIAAPQWAAAAQVGDGAAILVDESGNFHALTKPMEAEYLNETVFLITDPLDEYLQAMSWSGPVKSVALVTDGLQMLALKMPGGAPHAPFFQPLLKFLESEARDDAREEQFRKFLTSPRITQRADDDLTLVLASYL